MKFIAITERDYGSRPTILYLDANTKSEVLEKLRQEMIGQWYDDDDFIGYDGGQVQEDTHVDIILDFKLYEIVNEFDIPIKQWFEEAEQRTKQAKARRDEQAERVEFERLKEKYND